MTILAFTTLFLVMICLIAMMALWKRMIELEEHLSNKCRKHEHEIDELEKKLNDVCESLGYKEGFIEICELFYGPKYRLKKWDALLDHLGIEWVEESKEGFVKKTKKSK